MPISVFAVNAFVDKYSRFTRMAEEGQEQSRLRAEEQSRLLRELEAQCEQYRNAAAALEEHNVTLAAALKVLLIAAIIAFF